MSAIAGLWRLDGRPDAAEGCARMLDALAIYGRDGARAWDGGDVALGRRLTRVLPEDALDRQPLIGARGLVLVADVRVDNRAELGAALGVAPARLAAMSDADVLLAAYERWETGAFHRVAGDFACAVWDAARRRLVLACDVTARRALYYHRAGRLFAFASLPKGLHALPEVPYAADEDALAAWLALAPGAAVRAPFAGLERIEAGSFVVLRADGGLEARRYWSPQAGHLRLKSADDYAAALRERLDEAVSARLRGAGAGQVGSHLSGGLDSSAVAATAARLLAPTGGRVVAFTAVPQADHSTGGPAWRVADEGPQAAAVAALYPNMEHVLVRAGARSPLAGLDRTLALHDQPLLNPANAVWVDAIHDAARARRLPVMLVGDFGNLGLSYEGLERLPELLRAGQLATWLRETAALARHGRRWPGLLAATVGPWTPAPLWRAVQRLRGRAAELADYSLVRPGRVAVRPDWRPQRNAHDWRLLALRHVGAVTWPGVLAEWGVDMRDPTADRRLLEFCLGVPTEQFLRGGETRALARLALADRLPTAVVGARTRGYQAADWPLGLTAADVGDELARLEAIPAAARLLDLERMRRLVAAWPRSGWDRRDVELIYRSALLRALAAGHFLRRVSGTNA
ncbi:MAG TPA: asparagine synthase-related protein [Caulobacteraceae bacterium]